MSLVNIGQFYSYKKLNTKIMLKTSIFFREQTQSRSMMTRESSPVLGYSKPDQSMDYRSKKPSSSSKSQQPSDGLTASHQTQHQMDLQKELSEKIRHRRRSHSMSSKGERGIKLCNIC